MAEKSRKRASSEDFPSTDSQDFKRGVRSGKWSPEEEGFANRLVYEFESGWLQDCEEGCTLRSYLAKKLNCAPMRISKKFAGRCIGKLVFTKSDTSMMPESEQNILKELESRYHEIFNEELRTDGRRSSSFSTDYSDATSSESVSSSSASVDDISSSETDSRSYFGSQNVSLSPGGTPDFGFSEIDILRLDFFDSTMNGEELIYASDNIVEPHEWQDVLSFFCDDSHLEMSDN